MSKTTANAGVAKYMNWVLVLVLSGCCIYLVIARNNAEAKYVAAMEQKQQSRDILQADRGRLQADLDAASAKIDGLLSQNVRLTDTLQKSKAAITGLQARIRSILGDGQATHEDLKTAKSLIVELMDKAQAYELDIAGLERENRILTAENNQLAHERDKTVEANIALKMTGSILHASNVRMELIKERHDGREKVTIKANKGDRLRISFDMDENRIAESGRKDIYVRIAAPGNIILHAATVQKNLRTAQGEEIAYTTMKEIETVKGQPLKNVVVDWQQREAYTRGAYTIQLYHDGRKIGEGTAALR